MNTLIQSLKNPLLYPHSAKSIELIETHISWVLLTGDYAYKIKKPVNFGFLNFTRLQDRQFYCQQELKLNRRLAADLYLDVVAIYGDARQPSFSNIGPVIEYAVKMAQFPQACQLDRLLQAGELNQHHIESLADKIANFHAQIDSTGAQTTLGNPELIQQAVIDNFDGINTVLETETDSNSVSAALVKISDWSIAEYERIRLILKQRKNDGFVKECHGDMHLRNIIYFNNEIIAFDCLEFNEKLRWIDVMSELAFITMDLQDRKQPAFANLLLNRYLSLTGDYAGLRVFRYYLVYRAVVRAKVDCLRAHQSEIEASEKAKNLQEFSSYLALANTYIRIPSPSLYIMHGLSGSGKSHIANQLLLKLQLICLRSDIERKRAHGVSQFGSSQSSLNAGIYDQDSTESVYAKLCNLAELLLVDGWSVIVDASFLQNKYRKLFANLASKLNIKFIIIDCSANVQNLHKRIEKRQQKGQDVSEAGSIVLNSQISTQQELADDELEYVVRLDTDSNITGEQIVQKLNLTVKFE